MGAGQREAMRESLAGKGEGGKPELPRAALDHRRKAKTDELQNEDRWYPI